MSELPGKIGNLKDCIRLYGKQAQDFEERGMLAWAELARIEGAKLSGELIVLFRLQEATEPIPMADDPIVKESVCDALRAELSARGFWK